AQRRGSTLLPYPPLSRSSGVYAPPLPVSQIGKSNQGAGEQLAYTLVRPSTVTAELVARDGSARPVDSGERQPGVYRFPSSGFDRSEEHTPELQSLTHIVC